LVRREGGMFLVQSYTHTHTHTHTHTIRKKAAQLSHNIQLDIIYFSNSKNTLKLKLERRKDRPLFHSSIPERHFHGEGIMNTKSQE